jgi:hypothetical protein
MDDLIISKTNKTPTIFLSANQGILELKGTSIPEDSIKFYQPVLAWVNNYASNPRDTIVNIDLEYFNTSSSKVLLNIFKALTKVKDGGYKLDVNWIYEEDDEEVLESGQNFSIFSHLDFNFVIKN